jgi:hypothetical protein
VALAAVLLAMISRVALAGLSACETRVIPSANGKFVLVLLTPDEDKDDANRHEYDPTYDGTWTEDAIRERHESLVRQHEIEAHYPQSGLYQNDGSISVLWPLEYVPTPNRVYVSDDGKHLVIAFLDWNWEDAHDRSHAVELYAHGQPLATYNEDQLLVGYPARVLVGRFVESAFPTCTGAKLDDKSKTFEISTNWGDTFRFDILSGKLVDATLSWSIKAVFASVLLLAVAVIGGWWFWRRRRRLHASFQ